MAPVSAEELARVAHTEQACCGFFSFAITIDSRGLALEVRAPLDAGDIMAALFAPLA